MNIFKIILWAYLLGGEAILLAIAFGICRKDKKREEEKNHGGKRKARCRS